MIPEVRKHSIIVMDNCGRREKPAVHSMVQVIHAIDPQENGLGAVVKKNILIPGCGLGPPDYVHHGHVEYNCGYDQKYPVENYDSSERSND